MSRAWAPSGTSRTSYSSSRIKRKDSRSPGSSSTTRMAGRIARVASAASNWSSGHRDRNRRQYTGFQGRAVILRDGWPMWIWAPVDEPGTASRTATNGMHGHVHRIAVIEADAVVRVALAEGADRQRAPETAREEALHAGHISEREGRGAVEADEDAGGKVAAHRQR